MENYTFTTEDGRELRPMRMQTTLDPTGGYIEADCEVYLDGKTLLSHDTVVRLDQAIAVPISLLDPKGRKIDLHEWSPTVSTRNVVTVKFIAYFPSEDTTNG